MNRITLLLISCIYALTAHGQLKSPVEFLTTDYTEHFTPHHLLADYVEHVATNSDKVQLIQYGLTNQDRPLYLCYISTPENLANKENIRLTNLSAIDLAPAPNAINEKAIVWLSFGVHGNEAGASESSMNVLYELAKNDSPAQQWLENTLVILDPSINPDGYSRYTHWVRNITGDHIHPGLSDREHMEPWPGGRVNHYLFDLNRDWAWQTQIESQQRIAQYNQWMPQIHVDFHEMGYNDHYYFAPAAEPYHPYISDFQRDFQVDIGHNHASYFDKEGWLYFTREVFDLYYPSYGDTYPIFNGAIGMTHEKAGHGMAGRAIAMDNGDTLTLKDRIIHHTTTALSTVEVASKNADRLVQQFKQYFRDARANPKGKFQTYILKRSPKLNRLQALLDKNNITYTFAQNKTQNNGYDYFADRSVSFQIEPGDMIIHTDQAKSTLTQIFFEPSSSLSDSLTYDITAWSLPFAYGVQAYGLTTPFKVKTSISAAPSNEVTKEEKPYAYVIPWNSVQSPILLSQLQQKGLTFRRAKAKIHFDEHAIDRGSLIITRGDNANTKDFHKSINQLLADTDYYTLKSGFSTKGGDLGGSKYSLVPEPKALLISGAGTSANEVGQVWHTLDQVFDYPVSIVDLENFNRVKLNDYNTLILPDGYYSLNDNQLGKINAWVNEGGKLIAISGALRNFTDKKGWSLTKYATDEEKAAVKKDTEAKRLEARLQSYEDRERRGISGSIPGAIIENNIDPTHPLTFGLGDKYYSLKTGRQHYKLLKDAWNPIYVPKSYRHLGFIGNEVKSTFEETVTFAVENKGRGKVIYMVDNPLYRGFWENGLLLFANAFWL